MHVKLKLQFFYDVKNCAQKNNMLQPDIGFFGVEKNVTTKNNPPVYDFSTNSHAIEMW
jgi:hypothetical protein